MITINKDGYSFSIDAEKTREYYSNYSYCDCPDCRNFYLQIEKYNPKLTEFLSEFCVDILHPDELPAIYVDNQVEYLFIGYSVTGKMHNDNNYETQIDNLHITITKGENPFDWFPNKQTDEYFLISVSTITLPWMLDEPFPESESAPLLKRLTDKLKQFSKKKR